MRTSVAGGFTIMLVGATALAVIAAGDLPVGWAFGALAVLGFGLGPAASTSLVAPQSAVAWHQRGVVTSAVYASRMLGGALAVAAFGHAASGSTTFEGIALVSLAAACTLAMLAPREPGAVDGSLVETPAE
jgi:hypothetical protein